MTPSDKVIKLLLVEDSADQAEQLVSDLRNGGIAVQLARVTSEPELIEQLRARTPDLILANMDAAHLSLAQISAVLQRSGKDSSLIAMSRTIDTARMLQALQSGAWAHLLLGQAELLQHIVRRESGSLSTRRAVSRIEAELHESERRCDALLDSSRDPIAYVHEGMHVRANQAYLEMFGFAEDEIEGASILDLIAPVDAENFKSALKRMDKSVKPTQTLDLKALRADGAAFDAQIELSNANYEGEPCQQIIFRRQAASEEVAKQLEALRSRDTVTGLYNRQHCVAALERIATTTTAERERRDHALLLIEPDNFKQLTDTLGLDSVDLLMSELAQLMQRHLGAEDIAGRFSNQTLGMIAAGSMDKINELSETLRQGCEERIFELGAKSLSLTVSVGVSLISSSKKTNATTVLARANEALVTAQTEGGNRVHTIDPAAQEKADEAESLQWRDRIKNAVSNNDFQLHYQSVVSLQDAPGEYREMLLRMRGPEGEIKPAQFMPAAQRYGLLPIIDHWVITRAMMLLSERTFSEGHTFFIKLSLASLEDESLLGWLTKQFEIKKVKPSTLVFELPENGAVTALKSVLSFVRGIKKLGCGFALEGFTGGQTSMQLLKHTDADYLKIDRSFMQDLPRNKENESAIRAMCAQMRSMDKLTIAEFVEDATSMSILFSCGVDFVQGNFLQEPELVMSEALGA